MNLLITGATIVTCDEERRILQDAAIAITGDRIAAIGETAKLERDFPTHERMAGRGLAVLPGFVNAHTHTVLTALRGTVEDWDGEIIYRYMSPISYTMSDHERAVMAALGCLEAIRSGTTTLVDPFRHVPSYAGAMADTGLRLWLSESCADIDTRKIRFGEYGIDEAFGRQFLERTQELIETWHGAREGRVSCQVAAHAPDNCSPAMLAEIMDLAARHSLTRTCHLAQSPGEVAAVKAAHGLTPAFYLEREGFLGPDLTCAHWTFCTREDIELLAQRGVHMAHNPAPSSRKGPHRVLIGPIRDAGVNIALGTDNMTEDMFQAMKIGMIVHRAGFGRAQEGGVDPQPQVVLDMATRNGARTLGALDRIGSLEVGKKADITLLDLDQPALRPILRLTSNIVNYAHPGVVHSVMVDGSFVMRDRKVLTVDEPALLAEAQAVTETVWRRMVAANADIAPPRGEMPFLDG
ncbi:MAG TPA: amidohydrolase family protein [Bosea sp. (in: a-proteobacteria)]|jgi:5-methylthioadenosine/S-adenosylhomocysteine deaminase|uniref:amidohydrolase family protein n=1 Tax=Bosea sp. (in: a-proteobacteria) TaxID=1871050 RepID=UPI002DDD874E|nr:amidohydrolase family protein [Bosea sp. (in: a-proteobacteria)]HEV2556093.1 amidohydrolase family protein [Bosea sp. (in: a-proteobacteria)]